MAKMEVKGNFKRTYRFLNNKLNKNHVAILEKYGNMGVQALREYTPKNTGFTAESWYYTIDVTPYGAKLTWNNMNVQQGWANIAILIQTGHATRNGGYVRGIDYINPALQPIFQQLADQLFKEVMK